jgi:hypothetical protein
VHSSTRRWHSLRVLLVDDPTGTAEGGMTQSRQASQIGVHRVGNERRVDIDYAYHFLIEIRAVIEVDDSHVLHGAVQSVYIGRRDDHRVSVPPPAPPSSSAYRQRSPCKACRPEGPRRCQAQCVNRHFARYIAWFGRLHQQAGGRQGRAGKPDGCARHLGHRRKRRHRPAGVTRFLLAGIAYG